MQIADILSNEDQTRIQTYQPELYFQMQTRIQIYFSIALALSSEHIRGRLVYRHFRAKNIIIHLTDIILIYILNQVCLQFRILLKI